MPFPSTPTTGQTYTTPAGIQYVFDSGVWTVVAGPSSGGGGGPIPSASETTAGIIEVANTAEVGLGTDDARAVTPLKLAARLTALNIGAGLPVSAQGTLRNNGSGTLTYVPDSWATATRPASPYVGQTGYNTDLAALETWTGAAWSAVGSGSGISTWTTATRPGSPTVGQTGFNTTTGSLESWNGTSWAPAGGVVFSASGTPPATPNVGDMWFDTTAEILLVRINDGANDIWMDISSVGGGTGSGINTWTTATRPGSPTVGETGFNTDLGSLESWNGTAWATAGGATVTASGTAPTSPSLGDMWFDTTNEILLIRVNDGASDIWMDVSSVSGGGTGLSTWTTATRPASPNAGETGFNTDLLTLETWTGTAWAPSSQGPAPQSLTASANAVSGGEYWCDTSAAAITVTLPATPQNGDLVHVFRKGANDVTIARNGSTINGAGTDFVLNVDNNGVRLRFVAGDWKVVGLATAL